MKMNLERQGEPRSWGTKVPHPPSFNRTRGKRAIEASPNNMSYEITY